MKLIFFQKKIKVNDKCIVQLDGFVLNKFCSVVFIPLSSKLQFTFLFTLIYSSIVNKDQLRSCVELHVGSPLSKVSKLLAYFNMIYYYAAKVLFNFL